MDSSSGSEAGESPGRSMDLPMPTDMTDIPDIGDMMGDIPQLDGAEDCEDFAEFRDIPQFDGADDSEDDLPMLEGLEDLRIEESVPRDMANLPFFDALEDFGDGRDVPRDMVNLPLLDALEELADEADVRRDVRQFDGADDSEDDMVNLPVLDALMDFGDEQNVPRNTPCDGVEEFGSAGDKQCRGLALKGVRDVPQLDGTEDSDYESCDGLPDTEEAPVECGKCRCKS